jgi:hypothetical protein
MSKYLTWTNFDGTLFQRFCNMLLIHEISRHVVPFIAPGSDAGIDAMYEGDYEGLSGKWRFQAKFKSVATREAINKLRADIKSDIKKNLNEENILVFLTNVEIGPKQHEGLVKTANDALVEIGRPEVTFLLWDHAKLEGLIGSHGVVFQYFWGKEKRFLIPWTESFSSKIEAPSSDPSGFGGGYYGRDAELDSLWNWLHDEPEQSYLSILAPGGWGKTRLAIEFFKRLDEANSEWSAWMPSSRTALKPENLGEAVIGSDKLVILIDDADLFGEMEDLIKLLKTEDWKGRVKLLLTMRNSRLEYFYSGASPQFLLNRTTYLRKLGPNALYELCRELLNDSVEHEVIRKIVDASDGVPLIVRAMIAVANRGHLAIFQDKKLDFGKVVRKYLEEIYEHASSEAGLNSRLVQDTLSFSALFSPFTLNHGGKYFRSYLNIKEGELRKVMEAFLKSGIIQVVGSEMQPYKDKRQVNVLLYDDDKVEQRIQLVGEPDSFELQEMEILYIPIDQYAVKPDPFAEYLIADAFDDKEVVEDLLDRELWHGYGYMMVPNLWRAKAANDRMEQMALFAFEKFVRQLSKGIANEVRTYWDWLFRILKKMEWQFHKGNLTVAKLVFEKLQQSDDIRDSTRINGNYRMVSFREAFSREIKSLIESGLVEDRTRSEYLEIADFVFAEIKHDSWFRTLCGLDREQLAGKRDLKRQRDLLAWVIDGGIDRIEKHVREFYILPGQVYGWGGYHREKELSNSEQKIADEISALLSVLVQRLIDLYLEVGELESKRRLLISILMPILSNIDSKITQFTIRKGKEGNLSPYANRIIDFLEEVTDQENEFENRVMLAKILKDDTWGLEYIGRVDRVKDIYGNLILGSNLSERVFFFRLMQQRFGSEFQVVRQKVKELFGGVGDKQIAQALSFLWKHQHQIYKTKAQFMWGDLMNPISELESYDPESLLNHLLFLDQEAAIRFTGDLLNDLRYRKKNDVVAFQGFVGSLLNDPTPERLDAILQAYNIGPQDTVFENLDAFDLSV